MAEYIIFIPLAIQLGGLTPLVLLDDYIGQKRKRLMLHVLLTVTLLIAQNYADYLLQLESMPPPIYRTVASIVGYCLRPYIIVLFCRIVQPYKKHIIAKLLGILNAAVYMTALFSRIAFYISYDNHFKRGPLSYTVYVISVILLAYLVYCTIYEYRHSSSALWVALANVVIIISGAILDNSVFYVEFPVSYLTISIVSCVLFYYIWLHLEFVRKHEKDLMAEQRIKIMMSQIQPHFLYNTLTTIQSLCLTEPKKAAEITGKFGSYLRKNLDSLEKPDLIPIKEELEHTKVYADIEIVRFPKISVEYNIEADDFSVPALTVQPLVENAIRYGVRNRTHGIVEVTTKKRDDSYVIIIKDNGAGFDTSKPLSEESSHIGINNVKERIEKMCSGTLEINSKINEGTTVTITIPRR